MCCSKLAAHWEMRLIVRSRTHSMSIMYAQNMRRSTTYQRMRIESIFLYGIAMTRFILTTVIGYVKGCDRLFFHLLWYLKSRKTIFVSFSTLNNNKMTHNETWKQGWLSFADNSFSSSNFLSKGEQLEKVQRCDNVSLAEWIF